MLPFAASNPLSAYILASMNEQHSHILVVDDDARLRDLLTRYLGEQGFEVKAAADEIDRIVGLEMGADDYLPKPFNPRELLARIHAVLRRQGNKPPGAPEDDQETIRFGNIEVDLAARTLTRGTELQSLTTGEFAVLKVMLQHPRQPLSRDKLMTLARGREQGPFDRAIDVQVSRLRKLIEADPAQPRYLQTVWGFGYVFVPDGAARD